MRLDDLVRAHQASFRLPPQLKALCERPDEALAQAVHQCSEAPATRVAATTALLCAIWQMGGIHLSLRLPSVLLLPVNGPDHDPVDSLAKATIESSGFQGPGVQTSGSYAQGTVENAPTVMSNAMERMAKVNPHSVSKAIEQEKHAERFHEAKRTGFGSGLYRPYSKAWHEKFGLICDLNRHLILRLDDDADRAEVLSDFVKRPEKLCGPTGIGQVLLPVPQMTAVSGSLYLHSWTAEVADALVSRGLPVFVLPHDSHVPLTIRNPRAIEFLVRLFTLKRFGAVMPSPRLPDNEWVKRCDVDLRRRLAHLPSDYSHAVNTAVRELLPISERLAYFAGCESKANLAEVVALGMDFFGHALQGMAISIAGLAWHCLGFDPGCPLKVARDLLTQLRQQGPATLRDLLRKVPSLKATQRDLVLDRMVAENLVRIEGKIVTATRFPDFVSSLYSEQRFCRLPNIWQEVRDEM